MERRAAEHKRRELRRRERERADAELKLLPAHAHTPPPPSAQCNKFEARTYDRPWAQGMAVAKNVSKPSSCSDEQSASSEPGCSRNKGSVTCLPATSTGTKGSVTYLPATSTGTKSKTAELASKTPPTKASLASNGNKQPSTQCRSKHRSVDVKDRVLKKTNKPILFEDLLKWDRATISTRKDPVFTSISERHSLPRPLMSSPRHTDTQRPRLGRRDNPPSSPEDKPALQLIPDPIEGFSETNSITEEPEDTSREHTSRDDSYTGSDYNAISSVAESSDTLESSMSNSSVVPLSSHLPRLDEMSAEDEGQEVDDDLPASWQDTHSESYYIPDQRTGSQSSSVITSPSSGESSDPNHLTLASMTLHDIPELEHHAEEGGATAAQEDQTVTYNNPEIIRPKERSEEESSDEDGDQCRICHSTAGSPTNPLLTPCRCSGSMRFIHYECLKKWIQTQILSGSELSAVKTCELCRGDLTLDVDGFDLDYYYFFILYTNYTTIRRQQQEVVILLLSIIFHYNEIRRRRESMLLERSSGVPPRPDGDDEGQSSDPPPPGIPDA